MRRRTFLAVAAAAPVAAAQTGAKPPMARRDAFLGMHIDLHPNETDTELGREVTPEMAGALLDRVRPDYVQYDCKGHPGWLGYPSTVSRSAKMAADSLAVWRAETAKRGVALFIHFSGVWDSLAVREHPEWARLDAAGKPDRNQTSTFGPYVDQRMIPQLREAATKYGLDGVWVDGECWATKPDHSDRALQAWGNRPVPKSASDPGWLEWLEFHREQFRRYVTHYIGEVKKTNPRFQIASNWLYTTYVPERPTIPVDFLSGDYLGNGAISAARLDARYLSAVGKPWDLMAWGFQQAESNPVGVIHKPAAQLCQEASVVLAQGGGFQVYYHPPRTGRIDERIVATMEKVARFCRARQAESHKTEPVPQVGVLFSKESLYRTTNALFGGWGSAVNPARGLIDALVEAHYSVDVIPDWRLSEMARAWPVIVIPDWAAIGEAAFRDALAYWRAGGRLVVAGAENARLFAPELQWKLGPAASDVPAFIAGGELFANARGVWQDVEGGEVTATRHPTSDLRRDGRPAALLGERLLLIPGPVGRNYAVTHDPSLRAFLAGALDRLWRPALRVEAPPTVEAALRRKGGQTLLHLINTSGMQVAGDYSATDYIPAVGPIRITWNGRSQTVDRLDIHKVITL